MRQQLELFLHIACEKTYTFTVQVFLIEVFNMLEISFLFY